MAKIAKSTKSAPVKKSKVYAAAKTSKPTKSVKSSKAAPVVKKKKARLPVLDTPMTATQLNELIAERVGMEDISGRHVKAILAAAQDVVVEHLRKGGTGTVKVLGWNFKSVVKPAQKGGVKKPNPFKPGEMMVTKAKPESMRLKALALKAVKDGVAGL